MGPDREPEDERVDAAEADGGDVPDETDETDQTNDNEDGRGEQAPGALPEPPLVALGYVALAFAATAAGTWLAFDPRNAGTPDFLTPLAVAYAPLALVAVLRLRAQGRLDEVLRPLRGDVGFGGLVAAALYGCAKISQFALASPGSPREGWIIHLSLFLGEPRGDVQRMLMGLSVLAIGAAEELVWRGLVQDSITRALPSERRLLAIGATALLFGAAHLGTMFRLAVPGLGPNPLLVLAGLGTSAVWGWIAARNGRVTPAIFAHALFSWGVFEFPLWRL